MINIRPHVKSDSQFMVGWLNDEKTTAKAFGKPKEKITIEYQEKWFDEYESDSSRKFFTIEGDGKPIGFMGLSNIGIEGDGAELFILIGEDSFRGKSIGKYCMQFLMDHAFKELGLKRLVLEVPRSNKIAIILYGKLGFREIGGTEDMMKMVLEK